MSGALADIGVVDVEITGGWALQLKRELTAGDWRKIRSVMVGIDDQGKAYVKADRVEDMDVVKALIAIRAWNLVDDAGQGLPITRETLGNLSESVWQSIVEAMNRQYVVGITPEAQKN